MRVKCLHCRAHVNVRLIRLHEKHCLRYRRAMNRLALQPAVEVVPPTPVKKKRGRPKKLNRGVPLATAQ